MCPLTKIYGQSRFSSLLKRCLSRGLGLPHAPLKIRKYAKLSWHPAFCDHTCLSSPNPFTSQPFILFPHQPLPFPTLTTVNVLLLADITPAKAPFKPIVHSTCSSCSIFSNAVHTLHTIHHLTYTVDKYTQCEIMCLSLLWSRGTGCSVRKL